MSSILGADTSMQQKAPEYKGYRADTQCIFSANRSTFLMAPDGDNADEWFEESESEGSSVGELECLLDDMKICIDHHMSHTYDVEESGDVIDSEIGQSETVNRSFSEIDPFEKTLLQNTTMDWEQTENLPIILGGEKPKKVSLATKLF